MEALVENEMNIAEDDAVETEMGEEEYMERRDQLYMEEEVEEEEQRSIEDLMDDIIRMKLPKGVIPVYSVYKSAPIMENLLSEKKRTIFAEAFELEEYPRFVQIPRLTDLCLKVYLKHFTGGNLDQRIQGETRTRFGDMLDANFRLEDIIDLDIDSYWKRVFLMKCKNKLLVCQKANSQIEDWKKLGIQEKFREMLENARCEEWNEIKMIGVVRRIAHYFEELTITQLMPLAEYSIEKDPNLPKYKIYNYPPEDCHHINLEILGELKNLVSLHIEFQPASLGYKFDNRFFHFSYQDMENLAKALIKLECLKEFKIRRSRMDNKKLIILTDALVRLKHIELFDLSYCNLNDESGWTLATLLERTTSLKELILDGNYFADRGICTLFYGIQGYKGFLKYLSLARNPVGSQGVKCIGRGLKNTEQIEHLNLNGIIVTPYHAYLVTELINLSPTLNHLEMCALPLGKEGGTSLIDNLDKNKNILQLNCRGCDMTEKQEMLVQVLLQRNNYIKKLPFSPRIGKTREERQELDQIMSNWVSKIKHPVLLDVLQSLEVQAQCKEMAPKVNVFPMNIPKFIPPAACFVKTNKEMLLGEYYDTPVDIMKTRDIRRDSRSQKFVYDPNQITNKKEYYKLADDGVATIGHKKGYLSSSKTRT